MAENESELSERGMWVAPEPKPEKDWRDHVLLMAPPGQGAVLWARLQARSMRLRDWAERETDSEYFYRLAGMADRWKFGIRTMEETKPGVAIPFRAPHHSVSEKGLVGSVVKGWRLRPGELSLAHGGVLFIDEAHEWPSRTLGLVLDTARAGAVCYRLPGGELRVPAEFRLIATATPCPCGYSGSRTTVCRCSDSAIERWTKRLELLRRVCRLSTDWKVELEARKGEL